MDSPSRNDSEYTLEKKLAEDVERSPSNSELFHLGYTTSDEFEKPRQDFDRSSYRSHNQDPETPYKATPALSIRPGTASTTPTIPDGGLQAYLQVLSGFMLYFNSWGMVTAFGIFQLHYYNDLNLSSNSNISWIGTMQGFLLAVGSVFAGCVLDRGYPKTLVLCGGFFVVLGLLMTSFCHTYWQFMLGQGVCVGLGAGQLFIVAVAVLPGWFQRKRAIATGLCATGSSVGGIVYPIAFHKLRPQIGFGWTIRLLALIALVTILVSLVCAKQRTLLPPRPKIVDFTGFREPLFTLFALVSFCGGLGLYIPFFYIVEYSKTSSHIPDELSYYMLPILSAGSIVGRTIPALLADRYGCLKVLTLSTAASAMLAFCWVAVKSQTSIIVWSLLYGAFSGAFVSLQTPTVASITDDMRIVGGRMGMINFCLALGVLVGNPIGGLLVGSDNHWAGLQVFCGATLAVAAALTGVTWAVKVKHDKSRREQK